MNSCKQCNGPIDRTGGRQDGAGSRVQFCSICIKERRRQSYKNWATRDVNRVSRNEQQRRGREKHGLRYDMAKFNLTVDDYWNLFNSQSGRCAICKTTEPGSNRKRFCVDHDHACCSGRSTSCGKCVRGLLCFSCNVALGAVRDNRATLKAAIAYLDKGVR